ncbi:redox-sensitive transcriptional activator SoxR [Gordonia sp. CPCC 205333]|uniref:redox-sensitive transcriptional activator SoxR n=1 Tax=Gordonia sp. CPCC 205333 TaxID=3140790 RepID=UPI003AF33FBC
MTAQHLELTVGELADRSGVATSAIRYYDDLGLIFSRRTSGNQRRYHRAMLRRVAFIKASQAAGIPLSEISEVLSALGSRESPTPKMWEQASRRWVADLNRRIELLERMRDLMGSCVGCGCLSMTDCRLLNPHDEMAKQGPGPHRLMDGLA